MTPILAFLNTTAGRLAIAAVVGAAIGLLIGVAL